MPENRLTRRQFLGAAGVAASTAVLGACKTESSSGATEAAHKMERRPLGKTGERLSIVGFGGIVVRDETPDSASQLVAQAIERGINYLGVFQMS